MNYQKLLSKFNYMYTETVDNDFYEEIISDEQNKIVKENVTTDKVYAEFEIPERFDSDCGSDVIIVNKDNNEEIIDKVNEKNDLQESPIREIFPEEVRWFYKAVQDKLWLEFTGYDSIRIEEKYRNIYLNNNKTVTISQENTIPIIDKTPPSSDDVIIRENGDCCHGGAANDRLMANGACAHASSPTKKKNGVDREQDGADCRNVPSHDNNNLSSRITNSSSDNCDNEETKEHIFDPERRIVVRGGMYEVDLNYMTCESIYWPGEQCLITRGLYFYDGSWQPLDMDVSLAMEEQHQNMFRGRLPSECTNKDCTNKGNPIVIHTAHFPDFHVAWLSPDEIYLYSENAPSKIVRSVTHRLGFQKSTGYRLRRGYRVPASDSDQPQGVSHLVFVIHGIGQKMDAGKIIRNTGAFRECVDWLKNKYFPFANQRAEFFPVEWRSSLKLDSDMVDAITPHNVMSIRHLLNCSAMDIMYYTSPLYGMEVQRGLIEELNRLHSMFLLRNPSFRGPVSVLAHSLGSVILYDVITGYQPGGCRNCDVKESSPLAPSPPSSNNPVTGSSPLQFQIDQLFCLGSPLSVFIALRLSDPNRQDVLPPGLCDGGFYNIFHLSDPVAYRMEPLLCRDYRHVAPLIIQPYTLAVGGDVRYHEMPLEMIRSSSSSSGAAGVTSPNGGQTAAAAGGGSWRIWSYVRPPWNKTETVACAAVTTTITTTTEINTQQEQQIEDNKTNSTDEAQCQQKPPPSLSTTTTTLTSPPPLQVQQPATPEHQRGSPGSPPAEPQLKLARRLDYAIRETGLAKNYWSAITSHTSYWTNYDVAYFVLSRLFPELEHQAVRTGSDLFENLPV